MAAKSSLIRTMAKLGQSAAFWNYGILDAVKDHPELYIVIPDLCNYTGLNRFSRTYPDRLINVGIAEQNMIGIASGMALEGLQVFTAGYAAFAAVRDLEQIRQNLSVQQANVKVVGFSSGYTSEQLGISHWATEDISFLRSLPGMTVISPADAFEAVKAAQALLKTYGPAYIRLCGNTNCPSVYKDDYDFRIGKGIVLREGRDVAVVATGRMVYESLCAADILSENGIEAKVINIHTIKPLDTELLEEVAAGYDLIFTVEEHNITGGLGSAVCECLAGMKRHGTVIRLGMQDRYYSLGDERFIWEQAGITRERLADTIIKTLGKEE